LTQTLGRSCRENADARSLIVIAREGDQVRRGFSALSLTSLEYWIARSSRATTSGNRLFENESDASPVIASAAKQSMSQPAGLWIASLRSQ
jgi:hypothetical protein